MVSSEKPVVIKAEGKRLAFTSAGDQNGTVSTVQQSSKDSLSITAKELAVKAGNKSGRSKVSTFKTETNRMLIKQTSPET